MSFLFRAFTSSTLAVPAEPTPTPATQTVEPTPVAEQTVEPTPVVEQPVETITSGTRNEIAVLDAPVVTVEPAMSAEPVVDIEDLNNRLAALAIALPATPEPLPEPESAIPENQRAVSTTMGFNCNDCEPQLFSSGHVDPFSSIKCTFCGSPDGEDTLLLCDGCDCPAHVACLGLDAVPEGDWFCDLCDLRGIRGCHDKVYAYIRVSSKQQTQGNACGLDTQNSAILQYCMQHNLRVRRTVDDVGSGRDMTRLDNFTKFIRSLPRGSVVLVYSVSRLGRNVRDMTATLRELHAKECIAYSVSEGINTRNPLWMAKATEAENESNRLGELIRASYARRRAQGAHFGPPPFGFQVYRDHQNVRRLAVHDTEYAVLLEVHDAWRRRPIANSQIVSSCRGKQWTDALVKKTVSRALFVSNIDHPLLHFENPLSFIEQDYDGSSTDSEEPLDATQEIPEPSEQA